MTTTNFRAQLVEAVVGDLVGPYAEKELLRLPPSRWYLTGFLVPRGGRDAEPDVTADEDLAAGSDEDEEETAGSEPEPKQKNRLPASMGMSVLLPPGKATDKIRATLRWAEYVPEKHETKDAKRPRDFWRRVPHGPESIDLPLERKAILAGVRLPNTAGIAIKGKLAEAEAPGLPKGTRALSLFVVNERPPGEKGKADTAFIFQVEFELSYADGFLARPNQRDGGSPEWDERVVDLQFRDRAEYAVGHGVAVSVPRQDGKITTARTTWVPSAEVPRVITHDDEATVVEMEKLPALSDASAVRTALSPLVESYGAWIENQRRVSLNGKRSATRDELVKLAERARARIATGIDLLEKDPQALEAFRIANRAMDMQARRRSPQLYPAGTVPKWRLFQVAFLLLNLPSISDQGDPCRDAVELIFFPTGGGKTEAYLGVIAFTLVLRRLKGQSRPDRGLGVAVLLRYTLRLLTLDQLGRAATLICALDMIRREQPVKLGDVRFSVGLWVGRSATANTMTEIAEKIADYKASPGKNSPFPLTTCPWCQTNLGPDCFTLQPTRKQPTDVVITCLNRECDFSASTNKEGLPVLFVDEQIYRELPAFVVATVDKFAMLPWRGETGMLFGRVTSRQSRAFFGPMDDKQPAAEKLPNGLYPPELIVQDELHLISGPLGTMVGLYETAIEALCSREDGKGRVRPKILASTATVRRAREQIRALMGREDTALFPPPGLDDSETFFAKVDREGPGRLYIGVAAPGRSMKAILLRTYVALLCAAQKLYETEDKDAVDAYMTVAGYFNSLRELGGMRRLVEDDVRVRAGQAAERRPEETPRPHRWVRSRTLQKEPVELTSREQTGRIAESKARLNKAHADPEHVDVLLASNMISVGIDIDRLGLMVVAGQPKTTAEYIQASSRVGRQVKWPGLVVTCFNVHKPRDRSHYEQFAAYHESFYRFVEVTSLTPFSGPALDRGMAGTLVAMARLLKTTLMPPSAAMDIEKNHGLGETAVRLLADRAGMQPGVDGKRHGAVVEGIAARGTNLLHAWISIVSEARKDAGRRSYSRYDRDRSAGKPLLFTALEENRPSEGTDEAKFVAATSMRDVEPSVHLWLERKYLGGKRS